MLTGQGIEAHIAEAHRLIEIEPDESLRLCNDVLNIEPDNVRALHMVGFLMMEAEKLGLAYNIYERCTQLSPKMSEVWNNKGMCLEFIDHDQALECFNESIRLDPFNVRALINAGLMYLYMAQPDKAIEFCERALRIEPTAIPAIDNKAYADLMMRDWEKGWKGYKYSLGTKHRANRDYGCPEWDGVSRGTVVVYRDQGLGDEIMFASCLAEAMEHADIIVDCSARLEKLFARSFNIPVYGTGFDTETVLMDDFEPDYQCSLGDLPRFYRNTDESFFGGSYLNPDPHLVQKYKDMMPEGINVGIAWTGGIMKTHRKIRCLSQEDMQPLRELDINLFSLEYNDPGQVEGITHIPEAVDRVADHDETAAFIEALDFVITVPTTVTHTAGAIGKKCYCLVPKYPSWRFHLEGDLPWHDSVELIRQGLNESWIDVVERLAGRLENEQNIYRSGPTATRGISRISEQHTTANTRTREYHPVINQSIAN